MTISCLLENTKFHIFFLCLQLEEFEDADLLCLSYVDTYDLRNSE